MKKISPRMKYLLGTFTLFFVVLSCMKKNMPETTDYIIRQSAAEAQDLVKTITEKTSIKLAEGLKVNLWATDSLAPDPIALSINEKGQVFLTRTNRQKNSEFDIRGHRNWMTASISLQSVEERRAFLHKIFAPENSKDNEWLDDLNGDGSHDWRDLAVEQDEVWRLEDTDGDGMADVSVRVLSDFNDEIADVAGALLVRKDDAFVGIGPDLWRIEDTNNDGLYDKKTTISHGFAVHIGFGGHGMSGLIEGPDGKIYWGIGDIGASIIDQTGKKHHYPNQGVIVRCNADGSDFEVFSHGHRNTHEFVFDEFGTMISSDNDGDHPGESERLVHIVEGSDSGWRANWQYGKYTDPRNNKYNVWMDEKMYIPRWKGQAAYILPPIQNYHNGPTGMLYNPGTALGNKWKNKFFLVEFPGTPSRAHIWSFGLKPVGATYELSDETDMVGGILATGIRFGPDGAMYVADWITGWGTKNYGRVWKVDVDANSNDLEVQRKETKRLIELDFSTQNPTQLGEYLKADDQRVRQKAQFELAARGENSVFENSLQKNQPQLTRIHAIWGIGQLMKSNSNLGEKLIALLSDSDNEIIAQTCKVLGDMNYLPSAQKISTLLTSSSPRVQFYAAQALGRLQFTPASAGLWQMIEKNNDKDLFIRHAAVLALSRIGNAEEAAKQFSNKNTAMRIAAVLVLRQLRSPLISKFLEDSDEYIVTETARAINDDFSIEASLPALAMVLVEKRFANEALLRRAINAALRVGGNKELDALLAFSERDDVAENLRAEAILTLSTWANPSVLDRVDGRFRGEIKRNPDFVKNKIESHIPNLIQNTNTTVVASICELLGELEIPNYTKELSDIFKNAKDANVKVAALNSLQKLNYSEMDELINLGMKDSQKEVRVAALGLLDKLNLSDETLAKTLDLVLEKGSTREQQQLISVIGNMPFAKQEPLLKKLIQLKKEEKLQNTLQLEVEETVQKTNSTTLITLLKEANSGQSLMDKFKEVLFGGNNYEGRQIFNYNSTAQCVRCHAINGNGGTVGPELTKIGSTLSREQILQAMIEPSYRLAPGYGSVNVVLKDKQEVFGTLLSETDDEIEIKTSDAEPTRLAKSRIARRENYPSGMPPMGDILSKREIRNLVEYLSALK